MPPLPTYPPLERPRAAPFCWFSGIAGRTCHRRLSQMYHAMAYCHMFANIALSLDVCPSVCLLLARRVLSLRSSNLVRRQIGREVLDAAGRAVRAGATTDEIDRVVSGARCCCVPTTPRDREDLPSIAVRLLNQHVFHIYLDYTDGVFLLAVCRRRSSFDCLCSSVLMRNHHQLQLSFRFVRH